MLQSKLKIVNLLIRNLQKCLQIIKRIEGTHLRRQKKELLEIVRNGKIYKIPEEIKKDNKEIYKNLKKKMKGDKSLLYNLNDLNDYYCKSNGYKRINTNNECEK